MIASKNANTAKAQPELVALFVSDTHLNPSLPHTTLAFLGFLKEYAMHAQALYLLGDLFEYWAGDDDIADPYNLSIVTALREIHQHGVQLYWIAGNRDFLVAEGFASATGAQLLNDPTIIAINGQQVVLTHGDAQCTDDHAYIEIRTTGRPAAWQKIFLSIAFGKR